MPKKNPKKPKGATAEAPKEADTSQEQTKPAKASAGGKKKKILIVEDERPLAHALELKFAHDGFETHIATDGEDAICMAKKFKPDIILLDLIMPKVDGFTFLEEMKRIKCKTPVIVLSNLGQEEDKERAQQLGAKGYFVKSNTPISEIVSQVHSSTK
ncbi:MAG: response regulator [Candidatus Peribacteraceae bacterium]|jgi:DNA-binding response OmpR family regulator